MKLTDLTQTAIEAALSAGKIIQKHRNKNIDVKNKQGGDTYASQIVTNVDIACEKTILSHLMPTCESHDLAILTEETADSGQRFDKDFFWCVDPMDGTLAFVSGHPGFSVSIALVAKDGTPHIGVVYDPSTKTLYHAIKDQGAFKNQSPWKIQIKNNHLTYITDKKLEQTPRATALKDWLQKQVKRQQLNGFKEISGGGAVLNAIHVIENGPACMLKFPKDEIGGGSLWDYAATACIFKELGLNATNFYGGKLDLNKSENTFMNHEGVLFSHFIHS